MPSQTRMDLKSKSHFRHRHCPLIHLCYSLLSKHPLCLSLHYIFLDTRHYFFTSCCLVWMWWNTGRKEGIKNSDPYYYGAWCPHFQHSWMDGSLSYVLTRHKQILFTQRGDADVMFLLWILKQEGDKIKTTSCWGEQSLSLLYSDWLLCTRVCSQMQELLRTVQLYEELSMPRWESVDMCSLRIGYIQHRHAYTHCLSHWRALVLIAKWVKQKKVRRRQRKMTASEK